MRVAFCWDWDNESAQLMTWQDGLAAALPLIGEQVQLDCYTQMRGIKKRTLVHHPYVTFFAYPDWGSMSRDIREGNYDVYLFFADLTRPALNKMAGEKPTALCFTGGFAESSCADNISLFFVESKVYLDRFRRQGRQAIQAFGTNTQLFRPIKRQQKMFDAVFPATFADWKRHKLFAEVTEKYKLKTMACGWFQDHEPWCYNDCFDAGVLTLPHLPNYALPFFYSAAHSCVITSNSAGGSQRTVLEAMACNIPVIVMEDSEKCSEYVLESGAGMVVKPNIEDIYFAIEAMKQNPLTQGREYIKSKYTERHYANIIVEGLKSL